MSDIYKGEQLSLFDINLPPNTTQDIEAVVKPQKTETVIKPQQIPSQTDFSMAKVPDEEFSITPLKKDEIPTINEIIKLIEKCVYKVGVHEFLADIFEVSAIAVSNRFSPNEEREKNYKLIINKYDKDTRLIITEIFAKIYVLLSTQIYYGFNDYLGELYMRSSTSNSKTGQFFTPYNLSKMCAKVSISEDRVKEHIANDEILTMHEPTCGAGGMIVAAVDILYNDFHFNYSRNLLVECGDIDRRCVHMTYLQLALAGIPAVVYHRDGLSLETWDKWETPAYIMQWLRFRNVLKENKK